MRGGLDIFEEIAPELAFEAGRDGSRSATGVSLGSLEEDLILTTVPPAPTEGPPPFQRGTTGVLGKTGRRCWSGTAADRARDIVDADVPWNDESVRHPTNYARVLDYFNVGEGKTGENARYRPGDGQTFCNIYVHDVTRAMWASIPHWVQDAKQTSSAPKGWRELNANATADWLRVQDQATGWVHISSQLCDWLHRQFTNQQSIPFSGAHLDPGINIAASQIVAGLHPDPGLFVQDSYAAQQFANQGLPSVIAWKNPSGRAGHVAMVRPESEGLPGQRSAQGRFLPRSAQAGAQNWNNRLATWVTMFANVRFYIHA